MEYSIPKEKSDEEKKCLIWKGRTLLERCLILLCIFLLIAFLVMMGVLLHLENVHKRSQKKEICLSPVCKHEAGSILTNMDFTIDPCQNFYQFACGSHMKYKDIYSPEIRTIPSIEGYLLYQAKEMLEKSNYLNDVFYGKVKKYYQSCLNKPSLISEVLEEFLNVTELDSWPIFEDHHSIPSIENLAALSYFYGGSGLLFGISKGSNNTYINIDNGMITVNTAILLNTTERFIEEKQQYLELFDYVSVKLHLSFKHTKRFIEEMIDFETSLAKIKKETINENSTNLFTSELESLCPQIRWKTLFKHLYEYAGYPKRYKDDFPVKISSMKYIHNLCKLVGNSDKNRRIIYNLLIWNMFMPYLTRFDMDFRQLLSDIKDIENYHIHIAYGMHKMKWKTCIMDMEVVIQLGLNYAMIMSMQPEEQFKEIKSYSKQISSILEEIFSEEEWIDNYSKNITKIMLHNMKLTIGHSNVSVNEEFLNKIFNNLVITDNYMQNILSIRKQMMSKNLFNDSIYEFLRKERYFEPFALTSYFNHFGIGGKIVIPLGIMNSPFYTYGLPKYLNYGGIAMVMSHEFSHRFDHLEYDDEDENDDEKINIEWPEEFIEEYKRRKDCLINQYSQFPLEGNLTINGQRTVLDNIADNSGITIAFRTYEKYLKKHGKEPILPGLDFTNRQMFFIGYVQLWCEIIESMKDSFEDEVHSPGKYRALVPLMNFPEFSRVFGCPLGSYMNPKNKCRMWG